MDPALKYHDIFLKRYRAPRHRTPSHRETTENQTRESISRPTDYVDSKYANRIIGLTSPGRRTIKIPSRNESIVSDNAKTGKENRSVSVSVRSKQDNSLRAVLQHERGIIKDNHKIEQKHPDLLEKFQIYMGDSRVASRRDTPGRTPSAQKHRRLNSSVLNSVQSRAKSNERNSAYVSQNNSILNNSQLVEEYLNNSKENSFVNHEGTHYFSVPQSVNVRMEDSAILLDNEKIIDEGDQIDDESRESLPTNRAFEKGKALFKERNYEEAVKYLREASKSDPNSIETGYLLGVSYLWLGMHEPAIKELSNLLDKQAFYHKNVFILLSVAYKKTNNPQQGIKILTKAIQKFPKYYDAYITRGKLFIKEKKYDKALLDFNTAVDINPQRAQGFIGKGECFRMLGSFDDAVDCFTEAISKDENVISMALLKRAIVFIELKRNEDALMDLETLISKDSCNSEAYYFKGFLIEKKAKPSQAQSARDDYNEAILCFEQAIKHNTSKKAVIKSLYEITRIKIETRAFYEAYHTLYRAEKLATDQKIFARYRMFVDGVIYLMKRKFDEGVENISNVIKKNISDFLKPLTYAYRAYGYFCGGKIKKALQDYLELQRIQKLDKAASYNKILCEGILAAEEDQFDVSMGLFDKALKLYKNKMEPHFYKSVLGIYQFRRTYSKKEKKKLKFCLNSSLKDLERAIEFNDNNANAYYIKALMLYADGKFNSATVAIEKAIEKADENYPKYYFLRACIASCSQSYQKAISDCTITINLDKDYSPAYLERGKCYYTLGDIKQAFLDIQKYISIKPEDSNIHLWAGNLLFNTGAFEDAVRAYSNYEQINKCEELLILRAKCNVILKELNAALSDLNRLLELKNPPNVNHFIDRECLLALKTASQTQKDSDKLDLNNLQQSVQKIAKSLGFKLSGDIFHLHDMYFYKAVFHLYLGENDMALTELEEAWTQRDKIAQKDKQRANQSGEFESKEMIKILEDFVTDNDDNAPEVPGVFTAKEYLYNKAILYIVMQRFDDAILCLQDLTVCIQPELKSRAEEFLELIVKEKSILDNNADLSTVEDDGPAKRIDLTVFSTYNRLCSIFPLIKLPLSAKNIYEARLSFCLPTIYPPSMVPTINEDMIDEITIMSVENRPEAPWIKRNMGGVVFTENFLDREEKEIENLQEILIANNLNAEDLYASIEKSVKNDKKDSKQNLDDAMVADNVSNAGGEMAESRQSGTSDILKDLKLRRARTGAV